MDHVAPRCDVRSAKCAVLDELIVVAYLLSKLIHRCASSGYIWWLRTKSSPRDGSGSPTRRTAALSGAAPRPDTAVAGLPPTPDPAIRKLQNSVQRYCRHPPWGDLYESGLAL